MNLRKAWEEKPGEVTRAAIGIGIMAVIFIALLPGITGSIEEAPVAPTIGIFSLWPLLAVIAITLALVQYAISRYAPPTEDERG